MQKLKLKSDFRDYYDHHFAGRHENYPIFERMSTGGMDRLEMLTYLRKVGFHTPNFGQAKYLKSDYVIVITNLYAHCGSGKILLERYKAEAQFPYNLCVEFVGNASVLNLAASSRWLQIGRQWFWINYISDDHWRSNCGDNVAFIVRDKGNLPDLPYPGFFYDIELPQFPLFAIDFIADPKSVYPAAVDFNIAPGLEPVKQLLTPAEVVNLITEAYYKHKH